MKSRSPSDSWPDQGAVGRMAQELAAIFAETLDCENVGAHSDFFELGGHSVIAGKIVARARERLGISVSLRDIFTARTPQRIVEAVQTREPLTR